MLTDDERRQLDGLERRLADEDPALDERLRLFLRRPPAALMLGFLIAGVALLIVGFRLGNAAVTAVGAVLAAGFPAVAPCWRRIRRGRP